MELGEPDASGRRRPVAIEGSNFVLDVDCVIMAIGTKLNKLIRRDNRGTGSRTNAAESVQIARRRQLSPGRRVCRRRCRDRRSNGYSGYGCRENSCGQHRSVLK